MLWQYSYGPLVVAFAAYIWRWTDRVLHILMSTDMCRSSLRARSRWSIYGVARPRHHPTLQHPIVPHLHLHPSTSASSVSDSTTMTSMSSSSIVDKRHTDETFKNEFAEILDGWRDNSLTKADLECLSKYTFTDSEFVLITEDFALKHGRGTCQSSSHVIGVSHRSSWIYESPDGSMDRPYVRG